MNKKFVSPKKSSRSREAADSATAKTIVVCGDLVWDTHIAPPTTH